MNVCMHACMYVDVYNKMEKSQLYKMCHLVFAIDFGEPNLGGVLKSSIGFSEALKRSHYSLKMVCFYDFDEAKRKKGRDVIAFFLFVLSLGRVFWYFEDVLELTNL